jgi:hypothetical protein
MTPIKMRVNIAGFAGSAISMFCAYDPATDVLLLARVANEYEAGPRDDFLKITNVSSDTAFDAGTAWFDRQRGGGWCVWQRLRPCPGKIHDTTYSFTLVLSKEVGVKKEQRLRQSPLY